MIDASVRSELGRYKTTAGYARFRHNDRHLANASFALGMVASIAEKLVAMKAARDQVNQSTGRGLVVLKTSIVDDEFGKLGLNLRATRSTGRTVSMTAYEAGAIAFARGGTLDRIVGDAVAIMFSAPVPQADHRARAYHCAMEMQAFASAYSDGLKARGTAFGKTRIGVHTGEVIVGNFGGSTMFDYRALGDPVNTAARLEGANKYLGTTVCVSEATLSGVADGVARPIGRLVVKGKTQALQVYEPLTGARDAAYDAAFDLLRQAAPQALSAFEQLARERPHDTLVALHCERLRAGAVDDQIRLDEK